MPRRTRHFILACLAYFFVALNLGSPILTSLSTQFLGGDTSDAYEMARHIWWFRTALANGDDIFWHANLGYPQGFAALQLWAHPLQFFPAWLFAFMMPLPMAYNLTILFNMTLNGCAMYLLARRRLADDHPIPAWMAGLVFMVFPIFQGHLFDGHIGLMVQWTLPLLLLCLFEYADRGGWRWFLGALLFFLLACMGHALQIIYALTPLTALFVLARLARRDFVGATRAASVSLLGAGLLLLFLTPVLGQTQQYAAAGGFVRYSIDLLGLVSPSFENPFWGHITLYSNAVLGRNLGEGASYIGVLGAILALIGVLSKRKTRWWLLVAFISWLLALGPVLKVFDQPLTLSIAGYDAIVPLPYALVIHLPVFELARTPGRFMFLFAAAFAMLASYGMSTLWSSRVISQRNRYLRYGFALAFAILLYKDYQFFDGFPTVPADIPQAIHDLNARDDIRVIYNAPYQHLLAAKEALYLQTAHGKALVGGQDTRQSPVDPARLALLANFQPPLLAEAGVDMVILNKARAAEIGELETLFGRARLQLGEPFYEDERFALFENPLSHAALAAVYSVTPTEEPHLTFIYKEQSGWLEYRATLKARNRRVHFLLNDVILQTRIINGETALSLPLPIARPGYHTFRIALDPPCPQHIDTTVLLCHDVALEAVELEALTRGPIYDPIRIEADIELAGYYMPQQFAETFPIRFWWQFGSERSANDVRFVHVLDKNSRLMAQRDDSFGDIQAMSERTETVLLDLNGLPAGDYLVLTGWYALPDAIRYDVLTNVEGAQNNTVVLGTLHVDE